MSKSRKAMRKAQQNRDSFMESLNQAAKAKIEGETPASSEQKEKRGLMDIVRDAKPKKTSETKTETEAKTEMEPVEEKPEPTKEEPPQWAKELVASQKSFQETFGKNLLKVGKALDMHEDRLKRLEDRMEQLEEQKKTATQAELAKASIKAEAEEAVAEESEKSEKSNEPEPELKIDPKKHINLHAENIKLRPAAGWRARIVEDGIIRYSEPYTNIFVANQFATVDNDVEPFFGWVDSSRKFVREMTREELEEYGKYF